MKYSQEEIYFHTGQYDRIVSVSFKDDSELNQKYSKTIIGTFFYTLDERKSLEKAIKENPVPRTDSYSRY